MSSVQYVKHYFRMNQISDTSSQSILMYLMEQFVILSPSFLSSPLSSCTSFVSLYCLSRDKGKKQVKMKLKMANADKQKKVKYWLNGKPRATSSLPTPRTLVRLHENIDPLIVGANNLTKGNKWNQEST